MKKNLFKKLSLGLASAMIIGALSGCGGSTGDATSETPAATATETATETADTEVTETSSSDGVLVYGVDTLSSKFTPFFYSSGYDGEVVEVTHQYLLGADREGNMVEKGIEGETRSYNGVDYTYTGIADLDVTQNDDGTVDYDVTLREDIVFSDGTPMNIDDVIFSIYVLVDPTYDGSSTWYSLPIEGLEEYRSGMSATSDLIVEAGRDNTDFTYFTQEQQEAYWAAVDVAGVAFVQDIIDYCVAKYADDLEKVGGSEVALGMYRWGFGTPSDDGTKITATNGTEYATADVTAADYWQVMFAAYEGDLTDLSDTEQANTDLFTLITAELGDDASAYAVGVNTGNSADSISGITKTGDYTMSIHMTKFDATTIYKFNFWVAPLHYYGDTSLYDYDNNMFGFTKGDLSIVKEKDTVPLGAGPYVFQSYENGIVTFIANPNYWKGEPKTPTLLFQETLDADKLSGMVSGSLDITNPSLSTTLLEDVKNYNSNGELEGDIITTSMVDNLGYGYIGISSANVKVGEDRSSEESKNLRKALATVFAVYRDTVVNSYYGELASVIQYPISNTSWAAPKPADEGYQVAFSVDVDGNSIYTDSMNDEDKYVAALDAAVGYLKAAGYTYDDASGTFTAAPEGASLSYEIIIPGGGTASHPSYGILTSAKEALATIGITLEINDPSDSNVLWNSVQAGTAELWCAAWGATADPDMYQIYHSSNAVGAGGADGNYYGIMDDELDSLIVAARESADQTYRKAAYKEALDIVVDWAVEVPVYQRQNGILFSTERVNLDTLTPDITTFWEWYRDIENIDIN